MSITASSAALAKLEPFLLLAKNVRGTAAAKLIEEATAAPGCYVFSELLECDGIADVSRDFFFPTRPPSPTLLTKLFTVPIFAFLARK